VIASGLEWSYTSSGAGDPIVVLLPGGLGSSDSLFHLIEPIEQAHRVVAISLTRRGPGRPRSTEPASLEMILKGILAVLDAEGADRVHVIGSSYGGWLAQEFAERHPERVHHLILLHTFALTTGDKRRLGRSGPAALMILRHAPQWLLGLLLRRRVDQLLLTPLRVRHPDFASWKQLADESVASGALHEMAVLQASIFSAMSGDSEQPVFGGAVLIIESDNDPAVPSQARRALRNRYVHADVFTFHGTGHVSSILENDKTIELIEDSLAGNGHADHIERG
jgi:pimeloyl-ACP methyl ester carboxylesterase